MEQIERTYEIMGYDKDGDAYETLAELPDIDPLITVARCIMHYHKTVKELRRKENKEPFDWFVIGDSYGMILWVFTFENPQGIKLRD